MNKNELKEYKKADTELTFNGIGSRIDIKGFVDDSVILDVDPKSDDCNTVIIRRLYGDRFTYKGTDYYLWMFSRIM